MVANLCHEKEKTLSLDVGIRSGYRAGLPDLEAAPAWVVSTDIDLSPPGDQQESSARP